MLDKIPPEYLVPTAVSAWGAIWGFHEIVIKPEFRRIDDDNKDLGKKVQGNTESLHEIKGKLQDTKISLAKIETNFDHMMESVKEMKTEVKKDIFNLYEKLEALLKK